MSCAGLVGVQYSDGGACYKVIAIVEEEDGGGRRKKKTLCNET